MDKPGVRLTLIASDPRISAALMILSVTKMILIYLNYRFWSVKLRDIYAEVLDTLVFDINLDIFDMYRLFLFLWMFELIFKMSDFKSGLIWNLGFNSCAENFSYNTCADFWHACAKGLETTAWKHIVVKLIWPTGRQGQKRMINMPICFHFRSTSGKTSTQKNFSENFYYTKSFVLKFQGESLELFLSYHVHFRRYRHFRHFWHARAKNQRNC